MILTAAVLIICAALNTRLPSVESAVLFDSKNVTEYTIRLPTLKTPNIFKRLAGSGRKPAKNTMGNAMSSSSLTPSFGLPGGSDGSNSLKFSKNSGFPSNMPYAFSQMSFAPVKGRGSTPIFKYTGPPIWASDPRLVAKGNFPDGLMQLGNKNLQFSPGKGAWFSAANNKLPEESQNNMRVVVLRAPLDGPHGDDDPSLEESRNYRKFHKHKTPMEPEIQIINIPPRRNPDKRRFFGSQRPMAGSRPTVIRLPMSHGNHGFASPFSPAPPMHLDVPKQFIAEEKPLGNGRNTYIISEVDPNKQNSLNSLGNMDFGKNENFNPEPSDDWNLALPMKKSSQNMGPNFGSDYGSLLELQNAKQRHQSNSKNPVVIALSAKDQKAASANQGRANIQVLRTDSDSKVLVPPGMIAILVPQNFGIGSTVNAGGLIPGPDFDDDSAHSFFESSSTNKKTIVPLRSSKIEPSKSPGPPYKVDFTQGLPANSIAKPDFYPNFQNRMGDDSGSNEISSSSRGPSATPLASVSISAAPRHQIAAHHHHHLRNTHDQIQSSIKQNQLDIDTNTLRKRSPTQQALQSTPHIHGTGSSSTTTTTTTTNDDHPYRAHLKLAQTTTTAPTLIHTHYRNSSKTTSVFPKNHQSQPTRAPYPPAAFDTETAGIYLPRAATAAANPAFKATSPPIQHNPQVFSYHRTYPQVERRVGRELST